MLDPKTTAVAQAIAEAGGRALVVGGFVRDLLLGIASKDVDIEVYGLPLEELERVLSRFGKLLRVGRAFGVLRVRGLDVDFSMPRRDNKTGAGHRGFQVQLDPSLDFAEAARRRDLTINSIALDPLSGEIIDPHGGREDLEARRLRATDPAHFAEDPLRGLRAAQFAARFEMQPDAELVALCRELDLSELAGERLFEEFRKLLLKGRRPSIGLAFLAESELLRFFPELDALRGVEQDPRWHPEGDVWIHTLMVVDEAAKLRRDEGVDDGVDPDEELALMFGALCHDLGKPETTRREGDRITAHDHEGRGVAPTERLFERLRAPNLLTQRVIGLVRFHLRPVQLVKSGASGRGYRKLARDAEASQLSLDLLTRMTRADQLGRGPDETRAERDAAVDAFVARAAALSLEHAARDAVQGRHLIARGLPPGPQFKDLLARCRELQDETGWQDPERILDRVLEGTDEGAG
ncbi:MAG: HD domain-containing protein [Myxococcales bacterium]|nr:HD domain-containing protein [Myxococcales bacterium]